ncbi:hypothetical protein IF1G_09455 [Cordyceps javanica]|uniref:Uncharacterized protein n=1 Tax=Cordyceps javanica TaxID=43265 RepID=A0A545UQY3_9HYPO|nr:hypothetical protein IF1G_09455 [Cordyceps javanica]
MSDQVPLWRQKAKSDTRIPDSDHSSYFHFCHHTGGSSQASSSLPLPTTTGHPSSITHRITHHPSSNYGYITQLRFIQLFLQPSIADLHSCISPNPPKGVAAPFCYNHHIQMSSTPVSSFQSSLPPSVPPTPSSPAKEARKGLVLCLTRPHGPDMHHTALQTLGVLDQGIWKPLSQAADDRTAPWLTLELLCFFSLCLHSTPTSPKQANSCDASFKPLALLVGAVAPATAPEYYHDDRGFRNSVDIRQAVAACCEVTKLSSVFKNSINGAPSKNTHKTIPAGRCRSVLLNRPIGCWKRLTGERCKSRHDSGRTMYDPHMDRLGQRHVMSLHPRS